MANNYEKDRDLRVAGDIGAAIRLGLAEIVQRTQVSTPLNPVEAIAHMRYELGILEDSFAARVAKGKDGAR